MQNRNINTRRDKCGSCPEEILRGGMCYGAAGLFKKGEFWYPDVDGGHKSSPRKYLASKKAARVDEKSGVG